MSAAVLHGLVESGAMIHDGEQWRIEPLAIGRIHSSDREATFLTKRLDLLSPEVVNFLTAGAVIGKDFDIQMASVVGGAIAGDRDCRDGRGPPKATRLVPARRRDLRFPA
jgi:hypothetical protein